tara:strand:+ start:5966 stop:6184 length:219 start_codon:yes stop_codon:yes gene_type:complete
MITIINIFLEFLAIYFLIGFLFGLYFIFIGSAKIDPLMKETKKKVRVLLFPGVMATWPFLIKKLFNSKTASS